MGVREDIIGGQWSESRKGRADVRHFIVDDVQGPDEAARDVAATMPDIPRYGQPHPFIAGIRVINKTCEAEKGSARTFRVICEYGVPSEEDDADSETGTGEVTLTAVVTSESTLLDINGEPMTVRYTGFGAGIIGARVSAVTLVEANVERPQVRATIRKRAQRQARAIAEATEYTGLINDTEWSGFDAQTWLCAGIRSERDGASFMVSYDFLYNPETWKLRGTIDLTSIGRSTAPGDARIGNGIELFDVYRAIDFNNLGVRIR